MDKLKEYYISLGIDSKIYDFAAETEESLKERFNKIDLVAEQNSVKVIRAMQEAKLEESHLYGATGYGYTDTGRDTLEKIYANVFRTEDALVRSQITCGTHALTLALSGNLRPGDRMLSIAGKVYDTLQGVIGVRPEKGSLAEFGIGYDQVDLLPDGRFDFENIKNAIKPETKVTIQERVLLFQK